jgi:probable rRNA maturation factor
MASTRASRASPKRQPPTPKRSSKEEPLAGPSVWVTNRQRGISICPESVRSVVIAVLEREKQQWDGVEIVFLGNRAMRKLHQEAFGDPSPTDCMSFPLAMGPGPHWLGDVVVCPEIARERTRAIYREITLYVIHGLLHLLGYDDIHPDDRSLMVRRQNYHLRWLVKKRRLIRS